MEKQRTHIFCGENICGASEERAPHLVYGCTPVKGILVDLAIPDGISRTYRTPPIRFSSVFFHRDCVGERSSVISTHPAVWTRERRSHTSLNGRTAMTLACLSVAILHKHHENGVVCVCTDDILQFQRTTRQTSVHLFQQDPAPLIFFEKTQYLSATGCQCRS